MDTTAANPVALEDQVRAAVEEHVPDDLRSALDAWVTAQTRQNQATAEAQTKQRLADALDSVSGALNGVASGLHPDELASLIATAWRPKRPMGSSFADFLAETPPETDWLIPGVLGRGWCIKFAAREKAGKGTLIAYLLGALERNEETVFGPAAQATALIYSEEPSDSMREKLTDARLQQGWLLPSWQLAGMDWPEKVERIVGLAVEKGHEIIFVDNISRATGVEDESGVELARRAEVLFDAAKSANLSVVVDHHHRKAAGRVEDKSRGGTALSGATDNNIELEKSGDFLSRYRRVSSFGRTSETIWQRTIVLSEDRRSYSLVADSDQPQGAEDRHRLQTLQEHASVTVTEFATLIGASDDTARRALDAFAEAGQARKSSSRPYRYTSTALGI